MTTREPPRTEGDEHERVWNKDTEDVLDFLASLDRLSSWIGLPADNELDEQAYMRAKDEVNDEKNAD